MSFAPIPDPATPTPNGTRPPPELAGQYPTYSAGYTVAATALYSDLAGWLLATEIGLEPDTPGILPAVERVCQKLCLRLFVLVAPAGTQALLARALHLARSEFPFLERVTAGTPPEACLQGLGEHVHGVDTAETGRGLLAVLQSLFDLLAGFIGEDLTLRLVREIWPDLPVLEPRGAAEESPGYDPDPPGQSYERSFIKADCDVRQNRIVGRAGSRAGKSNGQEATS